MSVGKMNPKYGKAYLSYGGEVVNIVDHEINHSLAIAWIKHKTRKTNVWYNRNTVSGGWSEWVRGALREANPWHVLATCTLQGATLDLILVGVRKQPINIGRPWFSRDDIKQFPTIWKVLFTSFLCDLYFWKDKFKALCLKHKNCKSFWEILLLPPLGHLNSQSILSL